MCPGRLPLATGVLLTHFHRGRIVRFATSRLFSRTSALLNERELRRPEFSEGYPVKLADNQNWIFPRAKLKFVPLLKADNSVEVGGKGSFGPDSDHLIDTMFGVSQADPYEKLRCKFELATRLLLQNYALDAHDITTLIVVDPESEENDQLWANLTPVLMGLAPKGHSPAGSD